MIHEKTCSGKSEHTIAEYKNSAKKTALYFKNDPPFTSITRSQLVDFFAWLQEEDFSKFIPRGGTAQKTLKLSSKSIKNIHTNLSALWTWAMKTGLVKTNIVHTIDSPRASSPVVEPFSHEQIALLLKACDASRTWWNRSEKTNPRPTILRDKAIILTLLDTGCRASELCGIEFGDLDLKARSIKLRGKGPGRDPKERIVYFGKRTHNAIWKHLLPRINTIRENDRVFTVGDEEDGDDMSRDVLGKLLDRLGKKAGITPANPHRFRHTFAINYLRNGGDIFTLQSLLGHSSLEMVRHYARLAQTDVANAHRQASPVDNWKL